MVSLRNVNHFDNNVIFTVLIVHTNNEGGKCRIIEEII